MTIAKVPRWAALWDNGQTEHQLWMRYVSYQREHFPLVKSFTGVSEMSLFEEIQPELLTNKMSDQQNLKHIYWNTL